jgi:hypothetical protein
MVKQQGKLDFGLPDKGCPFAAELVSRAECPPRRVIVNKLSYSLIGLAFVATAAQAQQANDAGADSAEAPAAEAAAPADHAGHASSADAAAPAGGAASDAATSAYTDAEIDSFAKATVKLHAINSDASLDATQKQTQMAAVVKESGLDPQKYNAMGKAAQSDQALLAKVQTAMARHAQPSEG